MNSPVSTPLRRSGAHSRPLREPRQVLTSMMRTNYTASYNSYPTEYVNSNSVGFRDSSSTMDNRFNGGREKKSMIVTFFSNIFAIICSVPPVPFFIHLFQKSQPLNSPRVTSSRRRGELTDEKKKWNCLWWLLALLLLLGLLCCGLGKDTEPGGELVAYNEASDIILMNGKIAIEGFRQLWIRIVDCLFDILELISRGIQFTANTTVEYVKPVINMIFKTDNRNFLGEDNVNLLSGEGKNETTKQSLSPEEVNRMIYDAINKLNIPAIIQDIVKAHLESNKNTHVDEQFINNHLHILILEVLKKFSYDRTGEPDFALESAGGFVVSTRHTENYDEKSRRESIFGIPLWFTSYSPRSVIQRKSQNLNAGECWAIKGSQSYLVIQLARKIDVTAVSYEHLPKELSISGNIDSAPKDFKIWSLETENDPNKFLIGEYTFDENGEPLQRFTAQHHDPRGTVMIEFEVTTNHGAPFICLYRFRVHGNPSN